MVQSRWVHELKLVFGRHCHSREVDLYRMGRQGRAAGNFTTGKVPMAEGWRLLGNEPILTDHTVPRFFP